MAAPRECTVRAALALLVLVLAATEVAAQQVYKAQSTLVDCGASGSYTSQITGKVWAGDVGSNYVSAGVAGSAPLNFSAQLSNLDDQDLYRTARFLPEKADYIFSVTPGRHWLRLYFVAFPFAEFDPAKSFFSVYTSEFVLLHKVNVASVTPQSIPLVFREYSLNISDTSFRVTFEPEPGSYAFVNAIEVVSMPADAYQDDLQLNGMYDYPIGMEYTGLQTMYRVNVGGAAVTPANDSDLSRKWEADEPYILGAAKGQTIACPPDAIMYPSTFPTYIAPRSVYATGREIGVTFGRNFFVNITWTFRVDVGYLYYVRLHFAEVDKSDVNLRVFNVYLNSALVVKNLDLAYKPGQYVPYYIDFPIKMESSTGPTLVVAIGPTLQANAYLKDCILNGIEILKVNNSQSSLVGADAVIDPITASPPGGEAGGGKKSVVLPVTGAAVGALAVLLIAGTVCFYCFRSKNATKGDSSKPWLPLVTHHSANSTNSDSKANSMISMKSNGTGSQISAAPSSLGRSFSFGELVEATNNFDESLLLGVGGFGKVYKAEIGGTTLAVKRANPQSEQGLTEFQTEIEMLSKLRHRHLVSLIGYCDEQNEMILVYDYMSNGPLRGHLYGTDAAALPWRQRLEIVIGAARGLHYLHTGAAQGIIHRDVKTTNILLDENFVAKVSDFGLSKTGPSVDRTHVSTAVKGSFGYLDPEYYRRQQLTEKSDVYSFGVVLMEVLCARPAINPSLSREEVNLAEWAMYWQRLGLLEQIIDPKLKGYINSESLKKYGETAEKCLQEQGVDRPAMGEVLWNLEFALQLHENSVESGLVMEDSGSRSTEMPSGPLSSNCTTNVTENHSSTSQGESEDAASAVFSQLVNLQGR